MTTQGIKRLLGCFALIVAVSSSATAQHQPVHIPPAPKGVPALPLSPAKPLSDFILQTWTEKDGLPQMSAQSMCQTRDGYVWIGTYQGLVRYDGVRFVIFDKDNTPQINDNSITALANDSEGALWIGTRNGITRLKSGVFTLFTTKNGLPDNDVRAFLQDRAGTTFWIGTKSGLSTYTKGKISPFLPFKNLSHNKISSLKDISSLAQDLQGALWIGTRNTGLFCLNNGLISTLTTDNGLSNNNINTLLADTKGALWIGTRGGGVSQLTRDAKGNIVIMTRTTKNGLSNDRVASLTEDQTGTIWVGTEGGGLNRLGNDSLRFFTAHSAIEYFSTPEGLPNNEIRSLLPDKEGALWIGTNHGLSRIRQGAVTTITTKNGLTNEYIHPILQDRQGAVWIGTEGGLTRFENGTFTHFTMKEGLTNNFINALLQDRTGAYWIGTRGGGVSKLTFDTHGKPRFAHYSTKNGLPDNDIRGILETRDGTLWVSTELGVCTMSGNKFRAYTVKDGVPLNTTTRLVEDRTGTVWIGTNGGGVLCWKNGKISTYSTKNGLSNDVVWGIHEDAEGVIWLATRGGINRFKNDTWKHFTTKNGLFNDIIFRLIEDSNGYFWMTSMKGISRVRKADLNAFADGKIDRISCRAFGTEDGMKSSDCNGGSPGGWLTMKGELWVPTAEGIAVVHPDYVRENPLQPTVIIESVIADSTALNLNQPSKLSERTEKFEFRYTATSLLIPGRVRFKYMLEGYDNNWIDAASRRTAYYTNLPRGRDYRFRVQACNEDGVWNPVGASVMFSLEPYFWQTWWFALLGIISTGGALAILVQSYRRRIARLQEQRAELIVNIEERRRSERKFRALFETSPLGMILWERDGRIVEVNPAFLLITGYSSETIATKRFQSLVSDSLYELICYGLEQRRMFGPVEHSLHRADNEKVSVIISGMIIGSDNEGMQRVNNDVHKSATSDNERIWSVMEDVTERKRATDAMLRHQLNPHFMFNVLNSISALLSENPHNAKRMILEFSLLLRHTLDAGSQLTIPLGEEIEAVEHYLDIEKLRFEEQLEARVYADPKTLDLNVPVFLIQPLVENAIKYGMESSETVLRIEVSAALETVESGAEWLRTEVRNSGHWIAELQEKEEEADSSLAHSLAAVVKQNSTGIGLDNLRKRLRQLYADGQTMEIVESDGMVAVIIRIATRELERK